MRTTLQVGLGPLVFMIVVCVARGQTVEESLTLLGDSDDGVRDRAIRTVASSGPSAIASLASILRTAPWRAKHGAASALKLIGTPSVSTFVDCLSSADENVRLLSASALATLVKEVPRNAKPAIPALIDSLMRDQSLAVRSRACLALGNNRADAPESTAALLRLVSDEELGDEARSALFKIDDLGVPAINCALRDSDPIVRANAAWVIAALRRDTATGFIPALIHSLTDPVPLVRRKAAFSLGELGRPAASALPSLATLARDRNGAVSLAAREAIQSIRLETPASELAWFWWSVPYAFKLEASVVAMLVATWFALVARIPVKKPRARRTRIALVALATAVPALLGGTLVVFAFTREWAIGLMPPVPTGVPPLISMVASMTIAFALVATWACERKPTPEPVV